MMIQFTMIKVNGIPAQIRSSNSAFKTYGELPLVVKGKLGISHTEVPHVSAHHMYSIARNQIDAGKRN